MPDPTEVDQPTGQTVPGASTPSHLDPLDWSRRLTLAVLTGWDRLPTTQLHDLVRTLVHTPGLLTTAEAGVLLSALMNRHDTAGHHWAHLLTAADLPDPATDPAAQRDRLHLASRGLPDP